MSHLLWRHFLEDDVENFRRHLAGIVPKQIGTKAPTAGRGGPTFGSPSGNKVMSTSPLQNRKSSGTPVKGKSTVQVTSSRSDLNVRDHQGLALLHWIASSREEISWEFAQSLLGQPALDLSIQDTENLWTPLHRALYFGNVTIARALLSPDVLNIRPGAITTGGSLFKIKDREGNSPFDLFNATVSPRSLELLEEEPFGDEDGEDRDEDSVTEADFRKRVQPSNRNSDGGELFVFGSNKNINLGVGDEDDRHFPERVVLRRPKHLLRRLRFEHLACSLSRKSRSQETDHVSDSVNLSGPGPALVDFKPVKVIDVQLSKLHTAIITDDPEANLFTCGFGPGGRLGTGDESTRFNFTCIYGGGLQGEEVQAVGLGQDHTIAITKTGEVLSWGSNRYGQLGYSTPTGKDEDPVQLLPRKIYGTLKREKAVGCAASRIHSVIFTHNNLYTFGKNEGQLGLVDSDARSLELQTTPRVVAASLFQSTIVQVTAIDKATACLLESTDVLVFANYGYTKVRFPLDDFANYFLRSTYSTARFGNDGPNHIIKLSSGGDTIAALASQGQVFTVSVSQSIEPAGRASTTNPVKIKNATSDPQKVWSPRKDSMACIDVDVGQDGSTIICTKSGSVWRRTKRAKAKDATVSGIHLYKAKDYKYSRVPGLTGISLVRSNAFGSFAAIRHEWDVFQSQMQAGKKTLWQDIFALFPFRGLGPVQESGHVEIDASKAHDLEATRIRRAVLQDKDLEATLKNRLEQLDWDNYEIALGSTVCDIRVPCHEFLFAGRSSVMLQALITFRESYLFNIPDILSIEYDDRGKPLILFPGADVITLFNIVLYLYTDNIVDVWHYTRYSPEMTMRYKQVRLEVMKAASALNLKELERAARLQIEPKRMLARDLEQAYVATDFFEHADIEIELKGMSYHAHRSLMIQRCPFFQGMFAGFSGGGWTRLRRDAVGSDSDDLLKVDLSHIEPQVFDLVLQHLYADTGCEIFDDVTAGNLDEFLDVIMDVMAVANELMIDRLSQICQVVLGRFVTIRNVCQLLNAVAPCSVTTFKSVALEFICLNLEIMLENHLLDELDDDLMAELDEAVRENQDNFFKHTRRGEIAAERLFQVYQDFEEDLNLSRKMKVDTMSLRARRFQREEEEKFAREAKSPRLTPKSPGLTSRFSTHDLVFDMEEDGARSSTVRGVTAGYPHPTRLESTSVMLGSPLDESTWPDNRGKPTAKMLPSPMLGSLNEGSSTPSRPMLDNELFEASPGMPSRSSSGPWGSTVLPSEKLDMKQIMAQAGEKRLSNISAGLSAEAELSKRSPGSFKLSQKERKKQSQEQQRRASAEVAKFQISVSDTRQRPAAWQTVSSGSKVSLSQVFDKESQDIAPAANQHTRPNKHTSQTADPKSAKGTGLTSSKASSASKQPQRSVSSPVSYGRNVGQPSSSSTKVTIQPTPTLTPTKAQAMSGASSSIAPRSVRHTLASVEPSLQLSMADILAQQQLEKDVIKEATAKRSLQDIQQEQEFMEWWEAEEKATKARLEAEERAAVTAAKKGAKPGSRGRGKGRSRSGRNTTKPAGDGHGGSLANERSAAASRNRET